MRDIHEVLRRKQALYAQLGRQIEALQGAAEKLRMVAPLLAEDADENTDVVLGEFDESSAPAPRTAAAAAGHSAPASSPAPVAAPASVAASAAPAKPKGIVPRWP